MKIKVSAGRYEEEKDKTAIFNVFTADRKYVL